MIDNSISYLNLDFRKIESLNGGNEDPKLDGQPENNIVKILNEIISNVNKESK